MDDERGRVPFALVGVLLLVGSATLTVTLQPAGPVAEPDVDRAMERGAAEATTALRASVHGAAAAAARSPVLSRANTSAGAVLNGSRPFRDSLRVRLYLRLRHRLANLDVSVGDVGATASLPPTPTPTALGRAMHRVQVRPVAGNDTAVRVRVENVTLAAVRGTRTVARRTWTPTVVVRTPVLSLHDRVERFEARLNASLGHPGLAQRLTGYTYALTWARGYAQYGGAPVVNVVATGDLELLANGALLREQRAVFGRSDDAGRLAFLHALAERAVTGLISAGLQSVPRRSLPPAGSVAPDPPRNLSVVGTPGPGPGDEMRIAVNTTADRALAAVAAPETLSAVLRRAYTADARVVARTRSREGSGPDSPDPPDDGWEREECWTETDIEDATRIGGDSSVDAPGDWHVFASYRVAVTQERVRRCEWSDGEDTETTENRGTVDYEVAVAALGRHTRTAVAPDRPFARIHQRVDVGHDAGRDPNFAGIREEAMERLVEGGGGASALAGRHVEGRLDTGVVAVVGERPDWLREWVQSDLAALAERVRSVSTTVERGRVGTMAANPAAALAETLRQRHGTFVAAPDTYGSVAQRARVAARTAFLERVRDRLEERADAQRERRSALDGVLAAANAGSVSLLDRALGAQRRDGDGVTGPGGLSIVEVNGAPAYLPTAAVEGGPAGALPAGTQVHPLAIRNVNVFTSPHGDAVDMLVGGANATASYRSAARTLRAVETTADLRGIASADARNLSAQARGLREHLAGPTDRLRRRARRTLAFAGVGADEEEREALVSNALARWETPGARAMALANGSAARAIATRAVPDPGYNRALVTAWLGAALNGTAARLTVPEDVVTTASGSVRPILRARVDDYAQRIAARGGEAVAGRVERRLGRSVNRVPAGLPVLPTGTPWWTTTNVWYVEFRGGYDRFAVTTRRGPAGGPGGGLTYVRDGEPVRLDYDEDGRRERFGRADRLLFRVRTGVAIAVPPGPQGVGDKDGNADERSAGWAAWQGHPPRVPWADRE